MFLVGLQGSSNEIDGPVIKSTFTVISPVHASDIAYISFITHHLVLTLHAKYSRCLARKPLEPSCVPKGS